MMPMSGLNTHELTLADTIVELLDELQEAPSADVFDKGYRQGLARALDLIKQQSVAFDIERSVGLRDFKYEEWVG